MKKLRLSDSITFSFQIITPAMARRLLEKNINNRPLQPAAVERYMRDIAAGNWQLTHQCIAVDIDGNLVDGQHRLTAIVRCNISLPFFIATYRMSTSALNLPIDLQLRRTIAVILRLNKRHTQVGRPIFRCATGLAVPTAAEMESLLEVCGEQIVAANDAVRAHSRNSRGSSGVRAALAMRLWQYPQDHDYLCEQAHSFCNLDVQHLSQSLITLIKAFENNVRADPEWYMAKCFWALGPENRNRKTLNFDEAANTLAMRTIAIQMNGGGK